MDRFSPLAPAFIRVLLLPIGQISAARFADVVRRLQNETAIIKLEDLICEDGRLSSLAPSNFQNGELFYNYTIVFAREDPQHVAPFELFRKPSLVLGILDCSESSLDEQMQATRHAAAHLRERHPRVIYRQLLALRDDHVVLDENSLNAFTIRNPRIHDDPSLSSVVRRLSVEFLAELATYAKALEATPSVQTPGQLSNGLQHTVSLREDRRPSTPQETRSRSSNDTTLGSRPASRNLASPPHATSFEQIFEATDQVSTLSRTGSTRSRDGHRPSNHDRMSSYGFGPNTSQDKARARGKARVGIVTGHIHLMAGQWNEAVRLLIEHTNRARLLSDHIWHGKGLEGIMVALMLVARSGLNFAVPSICYAMFEKGHRQSTRSLVNEEVLTEGDNTASRQKLAAVVPDVAKNILTLLKSGDGPLELPPVVLTDARIRFCKLLAVLRYSTGDLNRRNLQAFIDNNFDFQVHVQQSSFNPDLSRRAISEIVDEALPFVDDRFEPSDRVAILSGIASVYSLLEMPRKKGLVLRDVIAVLTMTMAQARKLGAADAGTHPTASLASTNGTSLATAPGDKSSDLMDVMLELARIYRIDLRETKDVESATRSAAMYSIGSLSLKMQVMRNVLALCEIAPDLQGASRAATCLLAMSRPLGVASARDQLELDMLPIEESTRLLTMIERLSAVSKPSRPEPWQTSYMDPFLVRNVEFRTHDPGRSIREKHKSTTSEKAEKATAHNPLLYDRNSSRAGTACPITELLVKDEPVELLLTLQNPFAAPIHINSIEYVFEGIEGRTEAAPGTLLPNATNKISSRFTPLTEGDFEMVGCRIHVIGFAPQQFSIFPRPWKMRSSGLLKDMHIKTDVLVDDPRPGMKSSRPKIITIKGKVIPAQPIVELNVESLVDSHLMLLDGEVIKVKIVAKNPSPTMARVLEFRGVEDVLRFIDGDNTTCQIEPGNTRIFDLEITGRLGVSRARAELHYTSSMTAAEYTRVAAMTFGTTIHGALHTPYADTSLARNGNEFTLAFDLANTWFRPLTFTCSSRADGDDDEFRITEQGTLAPGEHQRLHLQMKSSQSSTMTCPLEELRANLVRRMEISWSGDDRTGSIDLAKLPLSSTALERTRAPPIGVQARAVDLNVTEAATAQIGQFVIVRVALRNFAADRSKLLAVELQMRTTSDLVLDERCVVVTGPQQRLVPPLLPESDTRLDFTLCPLVYGHLLAHVIVKPAKLDGYPLSSSDAWQAYCTTDFVVRRPDYILESDQKDTDSCTDTDESR